MMQKGYFVLAITVFLMMITLPAAAVTGREPSGTEVVLPSGQGEEQTLKVLKADSDQVESISVKDYVFGVVAAEIPMSYPEQAVKAQAVAAYTLMLHRMQARAQNPPAALKGADMTDDSGVDQGYITKEVARAKWGAKADEYEAKLNQWVDAVLGEYVAYQGKPAMTAYHCISGGRTETAENVWGSQVDYLVPVESVGDLMSEGYISEKTLTKAEFLQGLAALDSSLTNDLALDQAVGESQCSDGGTVLTVTLFGKSFTGNELRKAFSLRSANFDIAVKEEQVVFTVRGYGHLVGMSQFGAKTMAEQGSTYQEILLWYYPGCEIMR